MQSGNWWDLREFLSKESSRCLRIRGTPRFPSNLSFYLLFSIFPFIFSYSFIHQNLLDANDESFLSFLDLEMIFFIEVGSRYYGHSHSRQIYTWNFLLTFPNIKMNKFGQIVEIHFTSWPHTDVISYLMLLQKRLTYTILWETEKFYNSHQTSPGILRIKLYSLSLSSLLTIWKFKFSNFQKFGWCQKSTLWKLGRKILISKKIVWFSSQNIEEAIKIWACRFKNAFISLNELNMSE